MCLNVYVHAVLFFIKIEDGSDIWSFRSAKSAE